MDWGVALRFTLIIVAIFAAAILAILVFDAVWARVGIGAAIVLLIGALYLVKRWSARNDERTREGRG